MRRTVVSFIAGLVVGAVLFWGGVEVTGGWYTYEVLRQPQCGQWMRGVATIDPAEPVLNQSNPCLVRYRRFSLP